MLPALIIILSLILAMAIYMLMAPFYLEIDSPRNIYRIRLHRIATAGIIETNNLLLAYIKILWWERQFAVADMFSSTGNMSTEKKEQKKEHRKQRKTRKIPFGKIRAMLNSFHIEQCYINADLGDMPVNGLMYPVAMYLSRITGRTITINFKGENVVILTIKNNCARMAWSYFKS